MDPAQRHPSIEGADPRPGLAMVSNCMTPYRVNLHALLADGIPELKLHTLITHGPADFDWVMSFPPSIHATFFNVPGDVPTQKLFDRPASEWKKSGRMMQYLAENDVRAVILGGNQYLSYQRLIRHCYRRHIPLFTNNDSNIRCERWLSPAKKRAKRWFYRSWIPKVAGAMSMGELGDQFFAQYGVPKNRIYRLPYTPDYERFARTDPQQLAAFRQKYGLSADRRHLLFSGRLVPVKRVDLLIDAFAAIAHQRPDWDLIVVGDGVLRHVLQQRVPSGLSDRIIWTGFLEIDGCMAAYHASDVLVLPSDREPWAVVVQEAMAAGLPVISSDAAGAGRELVEDHVSGRIFATGDLEGLKQAIRDVTDPLKIDVFKSRSKSALDAWRKRVDPVAEVRRALVDASVLKSKPCF